MALLEVAHISKIYTTEGNVSVGISDVNLMFDKNEVVAITGSSGSGKSTLLKVLGGVENYEEGELYIDGKPTSHYTKSEWADYLGEYISFIFQDYNILESFTVLENVEFALTSIKDKKERHNRAVDIVKRVGLEHRINSRGSQLSGGEKQRTVIARAIAKDSPIILADEPTGNLDTNTARDILKLLQEISKDKLVIIVTHNYDDVRRFATRHIVIAEGKVESDDCKVEHVSTTKRDSYDFKEEHAYIFKEKHSKKASEDRTADFGDAVKLGIRRFTSRPKQTTLIVILMLIASLIMLFATAAMLPNNREQLDVRLEPQESRLLVIRNDGKNISYGELNAIKSKYGASMGMLYDHNIDVEWYEEYEPSYGSHLWKGKSEPSYRMMTNAMLPIKEGRAVKARGEVVVRAPFNIKGSYKVGDSITLYGESNGEIVTYEAQIVGASYYIGSGKVLLDVHPDDARIICYNGHTVGIVPLNQDNVDNLDGETFNEVEKNALWDELANKAIRIAPDSSMKDNNATIYASSMDELYFNELIKSTVRLQLASNKKVIDLKLADKMRTTDTVKPYIGVSPELYLSLIDEMYMGESNSRQVSLYFSDGAKAKSAFDSIQGDSSKTYNSIVASDITYSKRSPAFTVIMSVVLAVVVMLLVVLCLVKIALASKADLAIYRTMGISNSVVKGSTYIQMLLASIPSIILIVVAYLLMVLTRVGAIFAYMPPLWLIYLLVITLAITAGAAFAFNKIVYRENLNKGLRRVNK